MSPEALWTPPPDGSLLDAYTPGNGVPVARLSTHWNDLFWPLIAITSPELATPPRGILYFRDREAGSDIGPLMAATVIVVAAMVAGFLIAQRRFVQGLAAGGLKG